MYYLLHELNHAAMAPWRAVADASKLAWSNPASPLTYTPFAKQMAAGAELFERTTRRYAKPEFGIETTTIDGVDHVIRESNVWSAPFCDLKRFERLAPVGATGLAPVGANAAPRNDPKLLIVAPMSGHYATLLRGTVEAMLPHADVHITDWRDARMVPVTEGRFDLDDYIDYVVAMLEHLGPDVHVMAVCQPAVPVLAAVAVMEANANPNVPATMTLMGGPIDTRINPTAVNELAEQKPIEWFERRVIMRVPWPQPGFMRAVYPGFLQLGGFMSMNLDRHVTAHREFFEHLVTGDGDSAEKHRDFYDEYLAVMDLTAEFYLQTVQTVFIEHALPRGTMTHRGAPVDPGAIRRTALLTIEGENDDISGVGQTEAAHTLCTAIPAGRRMHHVQESVGHYGIFNGSRFRKHIVPRVVGFMDEHGTALDERASADAAPAPAKAIEPKAGRTAPAARRGLAAASSTDLNVPKTARPATAKDGSAAKPARKRAAAGTGAKLATVKTKATTKLVDQAATPPASKPSIEPVPVTSGVSSIALDAGARSSGDGSPAAFGGPVESGGKSEGEAVAKPVIEPATKPAPAKATSELTKTD